MTQHQGQHRISIDLSPEDLKMLDQLAGRSHAEVIRGVITLGAVLKDAKQQGGKILIEQGGITREVQCSLL